MREILAEAWPSETLGLGGIFRIVSGKVNTIQLHQIKIKIIRQSSTLCPTSLLVQSILMQRSTNGWRWFSDNLFLVSNSFLKYAVLWDGRPPQCPLCLCLKVLPVEFLKETLQKEQRDQSYNWWMFFFRDPGLDLRVEHSHGWGENSQVGFLPLISMKQIFDFQRRGDWSDLGLITGWALPLRHNPWWCWIPGILQHRWGKSESKF